MATVKENLNQIRSRLDTGLDIVAVESQQELHGVNLVNIEKPKIFMLIFVKLVHPFYLFQVFSVILWFVEDYTVYAIVVLVLSATSMTWEVYSEISNSNRLRELVCSNQMVPILRGGTSTVNGNGKLTKLHETQLVPILSTSLQGLSVLTCYCSRDYV